MAAYATIADMTVRIPEVAELGAALVQAALDDAEAMIDLTVFGDKALRAHVLYAAHILAAGNGVLGGAGGAVTAMSAGAISASFASPTSTSELATTRWGREFAALLLSVPYDFEVG